MANWIRCDSHDEAQALLALIISGSFNDGSHPHCRISLVSPDSIDVDFGPDDGRALLEIQKSPHVLQVGCLADDVELPDLWADREAMVRSIMGSG